MPYPILFFSKIKGHHAQVFRLGAFNHASFIFIKEKEKRRRSLSSSFQKKNQSIKISKIMLPFLN